jgi:hypothetical protein
MALSHIDSEVVDDAANLLVGALAAAPREQDGARKSCGGETSRLTPTKRRGSPSDRGHAARLADHALVPTIAPIRCSSKAGSSSSSIKSALT